MSAQPRDKRAVIRVDRAISCCERNAAKIMGNVQAILSGIESQIGLVDKGGALGLAFVGPSMIPVIRILTPSQYATWIRGIAVIPGTLVVGSIVLMSYAELAPLVETRVSYEMLSLIGTAIGTMTRTMFKERDSFCAKCCRENQLTQKHPRQRQRTKILRRL